MTGILGLLVLIADIWAIVNIIKSRAKDGEKMLWAAAVLLFPLVGMIVWYFAGPKQR